MELRPRRGRSAQPPSTPTIAKPSPRHPTQSSSCKKPASLPASPIHIPSDEEICADAVGAGPPEIVDEPEHKQDYQDSILPHGSEFETPLSSIAKSHRVRNKVASSNVKGKRKVASSVKKIVEEMGSTPAALQDITYIADMHKEEACIANDSNTAPLEKVGLDEAPTRKVFGACKGDIALKEMKTPEVLTDNVPRDSIELARQISVVAQEVSVNNIEVLSPSREGKKVQSSKKKSGKKRVPYKAADTGMDPINDREHFLDADAPVVTEVQECHGKLSRILSDDESAQVAKQVNGCEGKASTSNEAALKKHGQVEVSKGSSKGKKSRSNKDTTKEENLSRKLFEEANDVAFVYRDKESEDQARHELGTTANVSKEGERKIDIVNSKKYEERVISNSKRHTSGSLKKSEVADLEMLDSDGGKLDKSAAGIEGKNLGIERVHDVSEDSLHGAVSSSDARDKDTSNDNDNIFEVKHEESKILFEGNAVHDEECINSDDDDDDNASSGSDDGAEAELASVFVSSMKAHLQKISEPSVISMPKETQAKQEALERTESPFTKAAVKGSCVNGNNRSSSGYGLSWSPQIVLSASKSLSTQAGKARSIAEARPNTIWGRDRFLQDGLCVPPVDPLKLNKLAKKQKDDTTGAKWFNLSAPTITPELKKELQLLKLRGALDPKRHYKAEDSKGLPKYFQVGTVIGGPADFYSGRLTKKEQKSSLANELLSDSSLTVYRKRKYTEIQDQKQAGGKGFWKKKKSKRTPSWAKI